MFHQTHDTLDVGRPHGLRSTLANLQVEVRAGLRAWEREVASTWQVGRAQSLLYVLSSISGARRAVDSVGLRSPMDVLKSGFDC